MSKLTYITRGESAPYRKPRVFLYCHPEDASLYQIIAEEFFETHNCTIYYIEDGSMPDSEELAEINLVVIAVTGKLMDDFETAKALLDYSSNNHLPILPIMREKGLVNAYSREDRFGKLQYLTTEVADQTEKPYKEKLQEYLESVLISDALAQSVRDTFKKKIFLSYRKKDRAHAQELMRLIHRNEDNEDIAIWYDEFLVPGRSFADSILAELEGCDLFALAITPNLINEDNYVKDVEYKHAAEKGLDKMPVEMVHLNKEQLLDFLDKFPGIEKCMDGDDADSLDEFLKDFFNQGEKKSDWEYVYKIGLAYLAGINAEVDYEKALRRITEAANAGYQPAAAKLADMYHTGDGVAIDHYMAVEWRKTSVDLLRDGGDFDAYIQESLRLGNDYYDLREADLAERTYRNIINEVTTPQGGSSPVIRSACYDRLGKIAEMRGDQSAAYRYFRLLKKESAKLQEQAVDVTSLRNSSIAEERLGDIALSKKSYDEALRYYEENLRICRDLAIIVNDSMARTDLGLSLNKMGNLFVQTKKYDKAMEYYLEAAQILEKEFEEQRNLESKRNYAITFNKKGNVLYEKDLFQNAECAYRKFMQLSEEILDENSTPRAMNDCKVAYDNTIKTLNALGRKKEAGLIADKAVALIKRMAWLSEDDINYLLQAYQIDNSNNESKKKWRLW